MTAHVVPAYTDQPTPLTITPEPWTQDASCAQIGGDAWFPRKGEPSTEAKAVCRACPVMTDCLEYALRTNQQDGIWGGTSPYQRAQLRQKGNRA